MTSTPRAARRTPPASRTPLPLDQARVPRGTRPLTGAEHTRLLAVAAKTRKVNYAVATPAERAAAQRAQHQLAATLLRLFSKRVGTAHLADVLGRSEPGIALLLRQARARAGSAAMDRERGLHRDGAVAAEGRGRS
jgi:hypothetical protein